MLVDKTLPSVFVFSTRDRVYICKYSQICYGEPEATTRLVRDESAKLFKSEKLIKVNQGLFCQKQSQ